MMNKLKKQLFKSKLIKRKPPVCRSFTKFNEQTKNALFFMYDSIKKTSKLI